MTMLRGGISLLLLSLLLSSCVDFEPDISPVDWQGGTPPAIGSPELEGFLAADHGGDPRTVYYEQTYCPEGPCYRLCVRGDCGIWPADHPRVQSFIEAVDRMDEAQKAADDALTVEVSTGFGSIVSCVGFFAALFSPEPLSKLTLYGTMGTCGTTLLGGYFADWKGDRAQAEADNYELWARGEWHSLLLEGQP